MGQSDLLMLFGSISPLYLSDDEHAMYLSVSDST